MSMFAETILPRREDNGLRRWGLAALAVLLAHVGLVIAFMFMRQSEMPPGTPPDTVMINLAPIAVAPPPQEEVDTPPQPQETPIEQPPQQQIVPDLLPAPQAEVMLAPPPPKVEEKPVVKQVKQPKPQARKQPRTNLRRAATAAAPTPGFNGAAAQSWKSEIVERISSVKEYPEDARPASGTAVVAFSVNRNGQILGARLVRSSGSSLLDRAAVETVRRANPVPPPPPGVPGGSFTIPLHFSG
jgi:periplasmic protein TonB